MAREPQELEQGQSQHCWNMWDMIDGIGTRTQCLAANGENYCSAARRPWPSQPKIMQQQLRAELRTYSALIVNAHVHGPNCASKPWISILNNRGATGA